MQLCIEVFINFSPKKRGAVKRRLLPCTSYGTYSNSVSGSVINSNSAMVAMR